MIISRTPFRISFIGGGSDLESYYKHNGGEVISASINKYIFQSAHKFFEKNKSLIKYSRTENISLSEEISHPIIRNIFKRFGINQIDYNSSADIPSGTGMGSSSSFTVGLIKLCSELTCSRMTKSEIASLACEVEINDLGEPIGKQDQYAACFGGINHLKFFPSGEVQINPLKISYEQRMLMGNNLRLFYTGIRRSASDVLNVQKTEMSKLDKRNILDNMVELVSVLYNELNSGNIDALGDILNLGWELKKSITDKITNGFIDDLYRLGIESGATGGKLLGAGSGGFILFYVPINNKERFDSEFKERSKFEFEFEFDFDFSGTQIVYNDE